MTPRRLDFLICLTLAALIAIVFGQTIDHDFVQYDDPIYVTENPVVQKGLTLQGIGWAFVHGADANYWTPITWLSHMLDVQLFGPRPGMHHLTSVVLHAINAILLYLVLLNLTSARWPSAFVAAMFAIHPLHVESVAWIAERKDTLSTMFFLLAIAAYACYARRPSMARYLLVLLLYLLGLMSKPMVMTLPGVLLLLDYWPLKRAIRWHLLLEKIPFAVLAIACAAVTYVAQKHAGAVRTLGQFPIPFRIANAIVSYARYIGKTIWPSHLTVFYPPPEHWPIASVIGCLVLLLTITILALRTARSRPYLIVGWLWFLGTLLPVIGLIQVGRQAMADRYSYVPHIGLFIMIAFLAAEVIKSPPVLSTIAAAVVLLACIRSSDQVEHWRNTETLFTHALQVTQDNDVAHNQIGNVLFHQHKYDEAETHYRQAIRIDDDYALAHQNLGHLLMRRQAFDEAIVQYRRALELDPKLQNARTGLAAAEKQVTPP